ncbi:hypothetical protein [Cupriavidus sp. CuC1]|uniref:hypothetical protein n=1 Tax=Cupriavidus sp. CuC1 TaxID=3373131 RepID=UPI0037D7C1BB
MEFTEVSYEELPGFPGLRTFRCEPLRADLSPESCARKVRGRQNIQCSRCPVGAVHAANCAPQPVEKLEWNGIRYRGVAPAERCVRCGIAILRLIWRRTSPGGAVRAWGVAFGVVLRGQTPAANSILSIPLEHPPDLLITCVDVIRDFAFPGCDAN